MEDTKGTKHQSVEQKTTVPSITERYLATYLHTDEQCMEFLVKQRWPEGVRCPRCNSEKVHKLAKPFKWQCKQCAKNGYRFSPLVGTIFENTNVGLSVWFKVIFAMCHSKKGISALQIYRMVGGKYPNKKGAYRTAWYMCHRIRAAMENPEFKKLAGVVEIDETFVGGKMENKPAWKRRLGRNQGKPGGGRSAAGHAGKTAVIGAISRKGKVVAQVIENLDNATVKQFVENVVDDDVELINTDDAGYYNDIDQPRWRSDGKPGRKPFQRKHVNHSAGEYVRGNVHTNGIESFWSLLKRGIMGSFHHVSADYLPMYLNEFVFRFNSRKDPHIFQKVIAMA